jgi:hypothetical protein
MYMLRTPRLRYCMSVSPPVVWNVSYGKLCAHLELARGDALGLRELDGQVVGDDHHGVAFCCRIDLCVCVCEEGGGEGGCVCVLGGGLWCVCVGCVCVCDKRRGVAMGWRTGERAEPPPPPRPIHGRTVDGGVAGLHNADVVLLDQALHPLHHLVPPLVAVVLTLCWARGRVSEQTINQPNKPTKQPTKQRTELTTKPMAQQAQTQRDMVQVIINLGESFFRPHAPHAGGDDDEARPELPVVAHARDGLQRLAQP